MNPEVLEDFWVFENECGHDEASGKPGTDRRDRLAIGCHNGMAAQLMKGLLQRDARPVPKFQGYGPERRAFQYFVITRFREHDGTMKLI
jgi:hypothetical protein